MGLLQSAGAWIDEQAESAYDYVFGDDDDEATDADMLAALLGGTGQGVGFGPSGGQLSDIAAAGGAILPYLPEGAVNAAAGLVSSLLGDSATSAAAREMLSKATGWVFGKGPSYQGSPLTVAMAHMMLAELPIEEVRAIAWRVGGAESPSPAAGKREREAFALLYLYDALRALNAQELATMLINQTPVAGRKRSR